jgi:hypothetical protein
MPRRTRRGLRSGLAVLFQLMALDSVHSDLRSHSELHCVFEDSSLILSGLLRRYGRTRALRVGTTHSFRRLIYHGKNK